MSDWIAQFSFGFYSIMLTSTIIGFGKISGSMPICRNLSGRKCSKKKAWHLETDGNGDYLEHRGGTKLYHYDCNFNLRGIYTCGGPEIRWKEGILFSHCYFETDADDCAEYIFTEIRTKKVYSIHRKRQ